MYRNARKYRNAREKNLKYGPAQYKMGLTSIKLGQLAPAVQCLHRGRRPVAVPSEGSTVPHRRARHTIYKTKAGGYV
jgi:hypothetical protein